MSRLWRIAGWTAWVLLAVVLALAFYIYLLVSNV
jgi:hypothetical protein